MVFDRWANSSDVKPFDPPKEQDLHEIEAGGLAKKFFLTTFCTSTNQDSIVSAISNH